MLDWRVGCVGIRIERKDPIPKVSWTSLTDDDDESLVVKIWHSELAFGRVSCGNIWSQEVNEWHVRYDDTINCYS